MAHCQDFGPALNMFAINQIIFQLKEKHRLVGPLIDKSGLDKQAHVVVEVFCEYGVTGQEVCQSV